MTRVETEIVESIPEGTVMHETTFSTSVKINTILSEDEKNEIRKKITLLKYIVSVNSEKLRIPYSK